MSALVVGGSGFLGRNLIRGLLAQGEDVLALHHRPEPPFEAEGLTWRRFAFGGAADWPRWLEGRRVVYHLAWSTLPQSANDDPAADAATNIGGSLALLDAVRRHGGPRLVFASSGGAVYGAVPQGRAREDDTKTPLSAYGVSKLAVEHYIGLYARLWNVESVILRLANPYGPDQEATRNFGVVATFVAAAMAGAPCTIYGDGTVQRDFLFIDDAVTALIAAGDRAPAGGILNIGSGEGRSLRDLVAAIEIQAGVRIDLRYAPARAFDPPRTVLDASRAHEAFGWRPATPFDDGLRRVIAANRRG